MKRVTAAILCVLTTIVCFAACNSPEPDGKLTVYISDNGRLDIKDAIYDFNAKQLGVELEYVYYDNYEDRKKLSTELMAGKGPDVIYISDDGTFNDINKTLTTGAFDDLYPLIQEDGEIYLDDFYRPLLKACESDGKLRAMPLTFLMPTLFTTQEVLDKYNLPIKYGDSFLTINQQIIEAANDGRLDDANIIAAVRDEVRYWDYPFTGWLPLYNFEGQTWDADTDELKTAWDAFSVIQKNHQKNFLPTNGSWGNLESQNAFEEKKLIFDPILYRTGLWGKLDFLAAMNEAATPVLLPIMTQDGKSTANITSAIAISSNSKNKTVALEFVKSLVSTCYPEDGQKDVSSMRSKNQQYIEWQKAIFDAGYLHPYSDAGDSNIPIEPPEPVVYEQLLNMLDTVGDDNARFFCNNDEAIFNYFLPYVNGEKDFQSCYNATKSAMEIYLSE